MGSMLCLHVREHSTSANRLPVDGVVLTPAEGYQLVALTAAAAAALSFSVYGLAQAMGMGDGAHAYTLLGSRPIVTGVCWYLVSADARHGMAHDSWDGKQWGGLLLNPQDTALQGSSSAIRVVASLAKAHRQCTWSVSIAFVSIHGSWQSGKLQGQS